MGVIFCDTFKVGCVNTINKYGFVNCNRQFTAAVGCSGKHIYQFAGVNQLFGQQRNRHGWPAVDVGRFIGGVNLQDLQISCRIFRARKNLKECDLYSISQKL